MRSEHVAGTAGPCLYGGGDISLTEAIAVADVHGEATLFENGSS